MAMEETWGLQDYSDGKPTVSLDPVCGREVIDGESPSLVYGGVNYYFCSNECKAAFQDSPSRYVK